MTDVNTPTPQAPAKGSPDVPPGPTEATSGTGDGSAPAAAGDAGAASARRTRALEIGLGVVRLGVGAALMAAPGWAGRIWVGPGADSPGSKVFARALGARDVALGLQILRGVREEQPVGHWIRAGFAADLADAVAATVAARHLTPSRRVAMPLIAGAVGVAGVLSTRLGEHGQG
jgi:hypothetical protein